MKDKKQWIIGSGLAAAAITAVGAASWASTKDLVRIAVDRELPHKVTHHAKMQLKGSQADEVFLRAVDAAAEALKNRESTLVEITARDGEKLVGHWYPCAGARRIVVAMHGWRSSWAHDFGMISTFLGDSGCSVLYAEQRGQGASGGEYMGLGALERYDCLDWVQWAEERGEGLPIYLAGVSMGATTVLMAAGLELPSSVHGIIADSGFTSPHEIGKHIVENNLHLSFGHRGEIADAICKKRNKEGTRSCSAIDALRKNRIPVLLIHGTDDSFVPVSMTYENYKACAGPRELLVVPGADHAMSYYVDREKYEKAVEDFCRKYDA